MKRTYERPFVVISAVIERDGAYLLVKENVKTKKSYGMWNVPGGWMELEEDLVSAVSREVLEETGLSFTPRALLGVYSGVRKDLQETEGELPHGIHFVFKGEVDGNEAVQDDEIGELRWFTLEEVRALTDEQLYSVAMKKQMIEDHAAGREYPLELIRHLVTS